MNLFQTDMKISPKLVLGRHIFRISLLGSFQTHIESRSFFVQPLHSKHLHVCIIMSHVFSICQEAAHIGFPGCLLSRNFYHVLKSTTTILLLHLSTDLTVGVSNVSSCLCHKSVISSHPYQQNSQL